MYESLLLTSNPEVTAWNGKFNISIVLCLDSLYFTKNTTKALIWNLGAFILSLAVATGLISSMLREGCSEITDRGLKNVVEEIWEGKQNQGELK